MGSPPTNEICRSYSYSLVDKQGILNIVSTATWGKLPFKLLKHKFLGFFFIIKSYTAQARRSSINKHQVASGKHNLRNNRHGIFLKSRIEAYLKIESKSKGKFKENS